MMLIDTHIHLDGADYKPDLPGVISRAYDKGVELLLVPNVDSHTGASVIEICSAYPGKCFPMMGLHPTSVKENYQDELEYITKQLGEHVFVAIGEIGIDLYWDKTYHKEQEIAFIRQMELAKEYKLPVVIHSRKSLEEILLIIKKNKLNDIPGVFHCYPGSAEQAKYITDAGYKLGIGGVVTFKNAGLAEVVREIALEHLVLETDGPYLAPVPYRGQRNEPAYIEIIAQKVAELKNITLDEVAEVTTRTAVNLFPNITIR
jgi:TatD DNase family protein